jgi:Vanillate O-demethylase oxygenase C-terminal domain
MNAAAPLSARKTRLFVPICRNFDKDSPIEETLDFNYQVFDEDIAIVEQQFPEDLPLKLHGEAHFPADRSSSRTAKGLPRSAWGVPTRLRHRSRKRQL